MQHIVMKEDALTAGGPRHCPQFKANKAFQLALKARSSLDEALDDGLKGLGFERNPAVRAVASAFAGAKGAVMVLASPQPAAPLLPAFPASACRVPSVPSRGRTWLSSCPHLRLKPLPGLLGRPGV